MDPEDEDNTAVLRMKRDFNSFLSKSHSKTNSMLNFGGSFMDDTQGYSRERKSSVSMQQILEKERKNKDKEVEIIRAKTYINQLEGKVNALETSRKRARVEYDQDCDSIKQAMEQDKEKLSQTRQQLQILSKKEQDAKQALSMSREEFISMKQKLEQKVHVVQKERLQIETEMQQQEMVLREKNANLKKELMRVQTELEICKSEMDEAKEQLFIAQRRCSDTTELRQELEEKNIEALNAQIKVEELQQQLAKMDCDAVVTQAMKSKIDRCAELEHENKNLRGKCQYLEEMQENNALLREQTESIKRNLERAEKKNLELTKLQVKYDELQEQLEKWSTVDEHGKKRPMSPSKLTGRINELQLSTSLMLEKQGQLQAGNHSLEQQLVAVNKNIQTLQTQLSNEQQKNVQLSDFVKRAQRKINLVTKERDSYKNIIESYESEVTMNIASTITGTEAARVKELESLLDGYRKQNAEHEKELEKRVEIIASLQKNTKLQETQILQLKQVGLSKTTSAEDQQVITSLREKIAALEKELEKEIEAKMILEDQNMKRHAQGDFDPRKTKVIHFSMNPLSMAQEDRAKELKKLREDNAALIKRLEVIEEGGAAVEDITMRVHEKLAQPSTSADLDKMKSELDKAGKKNERLMEAFKKTSQEFREVCYQLLGYRLDIPCQKQYKLMSMYADSPEEFFMFKQTSEGMQMLGTDFSSQAGISDKIETYLQEGNSIPAFLSSVTIDLFSRQTIMH